MVDVIRAGASKQKERREQPPLPITSCPACASAENLRITRGMILCTQCCWAMELKQAG